MNLGGCIPCHTTALLFNSFHEKDFDVNIFKIHFLIGTKDENKHFLEDIELLLMYAGELNDSGYFYMLCLSSGYPNYVLTYPDDKVVHGCTKRVQSNFQCCLCYASLAQHKDLRIGPREWPVI